MTDRLHLRGCGCCANALWPGQPVAWRCLLWQVVACDDRWGCGDKKKHKRMVTKARSRTSDGGQHQLTAPPSTVGSDPCPRGIRIPTGMDRRLSTHTPRHMGSHHTESIARLTIKHTFWAHLVAATRHTLVEVCSDTVEMVHVVTLALGDWAGPDSFPRSPLPWYEQAHKSALERRSAQAGVHIRR